MKNFADTADTAATITRANNGWVANSRWDGPSYVATSLHELATLVEGPAPVIKDSFFSLPETPATVYSAYAEGFTVQDLYHIKTLAQAGRKIDAIKHLRNCFTARLNLKEAKELVEVLCG
jgi:ribosomal protein L7/L12